MSNCHKVPERSHLGEVRLEELAVQLSKQCLELLTDVLDCATVEEHEVKDFGTFADIFVPLSEAPARGLCLHGQVLEKAHEPSILNVRRLSFHHPFDLLQVIEDLLRLLHIILVACLEYASLTLLIMKKAQLNLNVHRVLKLLYSLLHGAKV